MMDARRGPWLGPVLVVAAIVIGAAAFRSLLVPLVFEPMAWLIWAGWRVLASVDRGICWGLVVVVCSALVIRLISAHSASHDERRYGPESGEATGDRLSHWQAAAAHAARSGEGLAELRDSVDALARSVAEMTRSPLPGWASEKSSRGPLAWISRLLPTPRKRAHLRAIEARLTWMESALEVKHDREPE